MKDLYHPLIVDIDPATIGALTQHLAASGLFASPYQATTVLTAYHLLLAHPVDVIFMEAELGGSPTLDLLSFLPSHPPVIIVSASHHYALACFDLDVADFIPKPFSYTRLYRAISRALPVPLNSPQAAIAPPPDTGRQHHIYLKIGRRTERFLLTDILYMETFGLYLKVYTPHAVAVVNEKISVIEKRLPENRFIRIHKSCIVNIAAITCIEARAVMLDTVRLGIGVTFQDTVHDKLRQLAIEA